MRPTTALLAIALPASLAAQVKLEVVPYFASYYATNYTSYKSSAENERQEAGPGIGLALHYHFTHVVGLQGAFTYVKSGIVPRQPQAAGTINLNLPQDGRIAMASARFTVQPRRSNYYLALGPQVVTRSGEAWQLPGLDHLTDLGAVVVFGIRAHITPEWGFNIGVEGSLYRSDFDGAAPYYDRRMQRDVLVTIGVPYALIGR